MTATPLRRLYLPIETKNREFDSRLLFAAIAADEGWSTVIGGKSDLYPMLDRLRPGILIEKSIQKGNDRKIRTFKQSGHKVCVCCEEGLMFFTPEDYCNRKVGTECLHEVERFFAWGERQADAVATVHPSFAPKIAVTGNSRIDLAKPLLHGLHKAEIDAIREEHGSFYLLNTKFARTNYVKRGAGFIEGHIAKGYAPTDEQIELMRRSVVQEEQVLAHFQEFVREFARRLPSKQLIIRPHPAEEFALWEQLADGLPNVKVVHRGNVLAWLLASRMSISNNCTTAVEAFVCGKPGINFRPFKDERVEYELPRIVAYQVESTDQLIDVLSSDAAERNLSLPAMATGAVVRRYMENHDTKFAAREILTHIANIDVPAGADTVQPPRSRGERNLRLRLRDWYVWLKAAPNADARARLRLRQQKFPGLDPLEIVARTRNICDLLALADVTVSELGPNVFSIERA
jgi:surface carbohydrate biosynthesis protein